MSEMSTATTFRVGDGEGVALTGTTQLAVVEDGKCYLIDLCSSGDGISMTSGPVIFQKMDSEDDEEQDGESPNDSIPLRYYSPTPNQVETQQVYLDDEQARAVANLLEFHNQQLSQANNSCNSNDNDESKGNDGQSESDCVFQSDDIDGEENNTEEDPGRSVTTLPLQGRLSLMQRPVRTYGKRSSQSMLTSLEPSSSSSSVEFNVGDQVIEAASSSRCTPQFILPMPSVLTDSPTPRKRRRIFTDLVKVISPSEFKQQLIDTSDIVQSKVDTAPHSKKAMHYLSYGGVGKLFAYPGRKITSAPLSKLYFSRLTVTTEPKSFSLEKNIVLEPLDPNLKTPGMTDLAELSRSRTALQPNHVFNDAVAKKAASSFDSLCKGMNKPPKFEYKRKKKVLNLPEVEVNSPKNPEPKNDDSVATLQPTVDASEGFSDMKSLESIPSSIHPVEMDDNVVYTIQETSDETKNDTQSSELFSDETQDPNGAPSNFEMLIAAAEHHNTLTTNGDPADPEAEDNEAEVQEDGSEDCKQEVVYCTNEAMQEIIVVGHNGERYRVTASSKGELTLWPENSEPS